MMGLFLIRLHRLEGVVLVSVSEDRLLQKAAITKTALTVMTGTEEDPGGFILSKNV
jgi:hypothetical protein